MPTPFSPAMDPQIERAGIWETFHGSLVSRIADQLNERLPENYVAVPEIRTRLANVREEDEWDDEASGAVAGGARQRRPDVLVGRREPEWQGGADAGGVAVLIEPAVVEFVDETIEVKEGYVDVIRLPDREIVTSIELLSPANKRGDSRSTYLHRRAELRASGVNLLEIDLLLLGRRVEPETAMPRADAGYCAVLSRVENYPKLLVYTWPPATRCRRCPCRCARRTRTWRWTSARWSTWCTTADGTSHCSSTTPPPPYNAPPHALQNPASASWPPLPHDGQARPVALPLPPPHSAVTMPVGTTIRP